jgi:hypothetical protein
MRSGSLFAASGAVPSSVLGLLLSLLYLLASLYVYISLIYQISARTRDALDGETVTARSFGLPEAILAALLILFLF